MKTFKSVCRYPTDQKRNDKKISLAYRNPKICLILKFAPQKFTNAYGVWNSKMLKITGHINDFWQICYFWLKVHQKRKILSPFQKTIFWFDPKKYHFKIQNSEIWIFFQIFPIFSLFWHINTPKWWVFTNRPIIFSILHTLVYVKWPKLAYLCSILQSRLCNWNQSEIRWLHKT